MNCKLYINKQVGGSLCLKIAVLYLFVITTTHKNAVEAQSGGSSGLRRSNSDPGLNRNNPYSYRRQTFSRNDHCTLNYKFDYIQLTLMWAPGSCSTRPQECKREINSHFTVHGLWPTIKNTLGPNNCCFDNYFYYDTLKPILPMLNEWWYSYEGSNRHFWEHEWLKHGTCSRDVEKIRGEVRYFNTTVQLAKQLPILETLKKSNIVPDNQKVLQSSDIVKALAPLSQGKVIQIDCDYEHTHPTPLVTGLNFCYDSNLLPSDCPDMKRRCQRQLILPYTSSRSSNSVYN